MEDKPKRKPVNFGTWYWIHLAVMLTWSAVCLGSGTTALRTGQPSYGILMVAFAALGLACLVAWYPLQDRQPTAQDRLYSLPLLVLGVFDALVLGGGVMVKEIHVRLVPSPTQEPSVLSLIIGGLCMLVGFAYVRTSLAERRAMRAEQATEQATEQAERPETEAKPEETDEQAGD